MLASEARAASCKAMANSPSMQYARRIIDKKSTQGFYKVDFPHTSFADETAVKQVTAQLLLDGYVIEDVAPGYLSVRWDKEQKITTNKRKKYGRS